MKKSLIAALILLVAAAAGFAREIRISSPSEGSDLYVYNSESVYDYKVSFEGRVSPGCNSIRVIWAPGSEANIIKYLVSGNKNVYFDEKTYQIDDFTLKQFQKGSTYFEYNAAGKYDNLVFGSNTYLFVANFNDGTVEYCFHTIYVHFGGYAERAKPVIYLYPTKTQDVKVKVSPKGGVTESIPEMGKQWKVTATPEGKIIDKATKKEYPYLYWESKDDGKAIDMSEGFVVETADLESFFEEKLAILGLNDKEIADFTEFWIPELQGKEYIFINFHSQEKIDAEAPLTISPKPDSVIRVYFDHKKLDSKIEVKEQKLTPATRKGFAAVEWGGKRYK